MSMIWRGVRNCPLIPAVVNLLKILVKVALTVGILKAAGQSGGPQSTPTLPLHHKLRILKIVAERRILATQPL